MASDVDVNMAKRVGIDSSNYQDLLISTYAKKCWNSQSSQPKISRSEIFASKMSHSWRLDSGVKSLTSGESAQQHLMDPNTMKWKSWTGTQPYYTSHDFEETKPEMNRLTKSEFRKLTAQVREVGESLNKFKAGNGFRTFSNGNNTPAVYRSQLAKSLKAFQPKQWKPYDNSSLEHTYVRCRPVSCIVDRSSTTDPTRLRRVRPQSSPVSYTHTVSNNDVRGGDYDRLTPSVIYELTSGEEPQCTFGERSMTFAGAVGTAITPAGEPHGSSQDAELISDPRPPSSSPVSEQPKYAVTQKKKNRRTPTRKAFSQGSAGTDTSDTERSLDPVVDIILGGKFQVPKTQYMRPEKLDDLYIPEGKKDRKKYDFDASIVHEVDYLFKNAMPTQLQSVDFRDLAEMKLTWREGTKKRPPGDGSTVFVDKLFDLETFQVETEQWERARLVKLRYAQKQKVASVDRLKGVPVDHKPKDRKCNPDCVQIACVGDCPEKKVSPEVCVRCRQKLCEGNCAKTSYDRFARAPRQTDAPAIKVPHRSRSCTPCSSKHNAKVINANNLVLGRPRSGFATYEKGRKSSPPKDLRPKSAASVSSSVVEEFSKLAIACYCPPSAKPKKVRPQGRAASSPGKSYFSQRRNSLTDHSVPRRPQSARVIPVANTKRVKSATKRIRPTTAH